MTGVAALLAAQDSTRDWRAIKNLILAGGHSIPALAQTISGKRLDAYGSMTCSNSTIAERLQPSLDSVPAAPGQPLTLAELNINCGEPAGPVQVTVTPGGQTINLLDDGVAPDQASGDGVYTAQWTPSGLGNYKLTFSDGDSVQATALSNYAAGETNFSYQTITGTNLNLGDDTVRLRIDSRQDSLRIRQHPDAIRSHGESPFAIGGTNRNRDGNLIRFQIDARQCPIDTVGNP